MNTLVFTLLSDGSSDRVLLRHLSWLLMQHVQPATSLRDQWADLRGLRSKPKTLTERVKAALDLYPCNVLFVHRDAESADPGQRRAEIHSAVQRIGCAEVQIVPVVPIRMQEAWLLFDTAAIRAAAGNPNGAQPLDLPTINAVEAEPDPKSLLHESLRIASGLNAHRLRRFHVYRAATRVADFIDDFSPLRRLPSFQQLESDLCTTVHRLGCT